MLVLQGPSGVTRGANSCLSDQLIKPDNISLPYIDRLIVSKSILYVFRLKSETSRHLCFINVPTRSRIILIGSSLSSGTHAYEGWILRPKLEFTISKNSCRVSSPRVRSILLFSRFSSSTGRVGCWNESKLEFGPQESKQEGHSWVESSDSVFNIWETSPNSILLSAAIVCSGLS